MSSCYRFRSLKSTVLNLLLIILPVLHSSAKEGMWMPPELKSREADMRSMGLDIPIDEIFNENGKGLNSAVVLFGRGCTGEIISSKGLVLTNHHCGYGSVQALTTPENDYFAHGYFAKNMGEEMPCPGLTVTFIRQIKDVTDRVLRGLADTAMDAYRDSIIALRIRAIENEYRHKTKLDAQIKPYFKGNKYYLAVTETFRDIRLVCFPPNGIGYFGGDEENWSWPRHTGDFSLFRVYAGRDNKPADYAKDNIPYKPGRSLTINTSGYKEGDFTMVYGFPGTTDEYITSYELNQVYSIIDPIAVNARTLKLAAWKKHMDASRDVFLEYTSKYAGVANGWKKWQGEMHGLQVNDVMGKKEAYQQKMQVWASGHNILPYAATLLAQIEADAKADDSLIKAAVYMQEYPLAIELVQQGGTLDGLLPVFRAGLPAEKLRDTLKKLTAGLKGFYKNYDVAVDKDVFTTLMPHYFSDCYRWVPSFYKLEFEVYKNDYQAWADAVYDISMIASAAKLNDFVNNAQPGDSMRIQSDPAWQLYHAINQLRNDKIYPVLTASRSRLRYLDRLYMKEQLVADKEKAFYPDANLTLRVAYGTVKGIDPEGTAGYSYQTTLDEAIALDDPNNDIFRVPEKLKELYSKKDYGRWAVNGTVPLAFIADNHTSGGNSGSPVLNAKGELIGTNFDRVWEGTMSDYYFDPNLCRNISLDIRYTLFIIEKFGGAGWLLDEMRIDDKPVKTKKHA